MSRVPKSMPGVNDGEQDFDVPSASRRNALHTLAGLCAWRALGAAFSPLGLALAISPARAASDWPSRPIRLVVPFPPGGSTDILGREIGHELQAALGQPIVVENKPGAGGSIGSTEAARAAADGYTLVFYGWGKRIGLPVNELRNYTALKDRLMQRPAVRKILEREQSVLLQN